MLNLCSLYVLQRSTRLSGTGSCPAQSADVYFFPVHVPNIGTVADLGQQFRVSLGL